MTNDLLCEIDGCNRHSRRTGRCDNHQGTDNDSQRAAVNDDPKVLDCHCSLGNSRGHSHDLPPNHCYCVDREIQKPSDHWVTCPKRKADQ